MALPKEIYDLLKDLKHGEKSIVDIIREVDDKADAVVKVQEANKNLSTVRDALDAENKKLKLEAEQSKGKIETLTADLSKSGEKVPAVIEAKINKLSSDYEAMKTLLEAEQKKSSQKEKEAVESNIASRQMKTENDLLQALGGVGIKDQKNIQLAMALVKSGGYVKVTANDKGAIEELLTIPKNGKPETATVSDIAAFLAKEYEGLVSPSGNQGPGGRTAQSPPRKEDNNEAKTYEEIQKKRSDYADMIVQAALPKK